MSAIPLEHDEIYYPDSDGLPMADNDLQRKVMTDLLHALETRYAKDPDMYISGNLFIYYVQGDPGASIAPDAFVVPGAGKGLRRSYKLWKERRVPVIAFEIVSETGWSKVLKEKKDTYQKLGIEEYVVFDPDGEFISPRLQGFRLVDGRYRRIPLEPDGSWVIRTLGLRIVPEGENLRLIDLSTGERYLWAGEEASARKAAEEEVARLRAEIERLKASG